MLKKLILDLYTALYKGFAEVKIGDYMATPEVMEKELKHVVPEPTKAELEALKPTVGGFALYAAGVVILIVGAAVIGRTHIRQTALRKAAAQKAARRKKAAAKKKAAAAATETEFVPTAAE